MNNSSIDEIPPDPDSTTFVGLSDMAERLFGSTSRSAKARVARMADRGELAAIRIGQRGDRLFPLAEVERLHREALATRMVGRTTPAENQ